MRIDLTVKLNYQPLEYQELSKEYVDELNDFISTSTEENIDLDLLERLMLSACNLGLTDVFVVLSQIKKKKVFLKEWVKDLLLHIQFVKQLNLKGDKIFT